MKNIFKKDSNILIFVLVGLFLILFESVFSIPNIYPEYVTATDINTEFQYYTIHAFYGATIVDLDQVVFTEWIVFPNVLGYIFVILGLKRLFKKSGVFKFSAFMSYLGIVINALIFILPLLFTGKLLSYIAILMAIVRLGIKISVVYFFIWGICQLLSGIAYKTDRRIIAITWIVAVFCQMVILVTSWTMLTKTTVVYEIILLFITALYLFFIYRLRDYIVGEIKLIEVKK